MALKKIIVPMFDPQKEKHPEVLDLLDSDKQAHWLDLFNGESYWCKLYWVDGRFITMTKVNVVNGGIVVNNIPVKDIIENTSENDMSMKWEIMTVVCLTYLITKEKEIRVGEKTMRFSLGSNYKYNKNKPVVLRDYVYEKKECQGRKYEKQANEWLVRGHYRRYKSGLNVFVKGYKKTFSNFS